MSKPPISKRIGSTWEKIDGWPYYVSDGGQVWSTRSEKVLKPYPNQGGEYLVVDLRKDGKRWQRYVHRIVLEEHVGEAPEKEANHIDGDPSNNDLGNLEWVEPEDNIPETAGQSDGDGLGAIDSAPF